LAFSSLDNREPEKVPGTVKKESRSKEKERGDGKKCQGKGAAFIKIAPENPVLWTGMKGASAEGRKKTNQMLKQVQHDMMVRFWSFCHPELGPELDSGSIDFSISFLGLRI
jgi:hypothetical protein